MSTPPIEKKRSRESFLPALKRIAKRLSEKQVYSFEWKDKYLRVTRESEVRAKTLWVFGSWARGALRCGDLDLLLEVSVDKGFHPPHKTITKKMAGSAPDVRIYVGTLEENSSHAVIEDAVLIWSPSQPDWEKSIDSIKPDPSAGSHPRPTDIIPLRNEQLSEEIEGLENLVNLHDEGILQWSWVEAETIAPDENSWPEDATDFFKHRVRRLGKKTAAVWPFLVEYIFRKYSVFDWSAVEFEDRLWFQSEGFHAVTGMPSVPYKCLDELSCSELIIAAHHSRRGPNGLWIIKRGKAHPLEKLFGNVKPFYLLNEFDGLPDKDYWYHEERHPRRKKQFATVLNLYPTEADAKAAAEEANDFIKKLEEENSTSFDEKYSVVSVGGADLLQLISQSDIVTFGDFYVAITDVGEWYCKVKGKAFTKDARELKRVLTGMI